MLMKADEGALRVGGRPAESLLCKEQRPWQEGGGEVGRAQGGLPPRKGRAGAGHWLEASIPRDKMASVHRRPDASWGGSCWPEIPSRAPLLQHFPAPRAAAARAARAARLRPRLPPQRKGGAARLSHLLAAS